MSISAGTRELSLEEIKRAQKRPWRRRDAFDMNRPTLAGLIGRYGLLVGVLLLSVGPFLWQLSTSFKGVNEDIYQFPPAILPEDPTFAWYESVNALIPIYDYAVHSAMVAFGTVASNVVFATLGGYVLGVLRFKGRKVVIGLFLSTLLLPGEVTLTSQFLLVNSMGLTDTLFGVYIPHAIGAVNVLLMMAATRTIPESIFDAAVLDGANTFQRIRHVVWPNVHGMASVVGIFAFIGAWDEYLWPLIVLTNPDNFTLSVGMAYLNSALGANPREIAAGTMIALIPILIVFAVGQRTFFRGVESGAVKG